MRNILIKVSGYKSRLLQAAPGASDTVLKKGLGNPFLISLISVCVLLPSVGEHLYELHSMHEHVERVLQASDYPDNSRSEAGTEMKKGSVRPPSNGAEFDTYPPEVPRLAGTVVTPLQRFAFLEYSDGVTFSLEEGGQLGRIVVTGINDGRATLTWPRGSVTLEVQASGTPQVGAEKPDLTGSNEVSAVAANMRMVRQRISTTVAFRSKALRRHMRRAYDRPTDLLTRGL